MGLPPTGGWSSLVWSGVSSVWLVSSSVVVVAGPNVKGRVVVVGKVAAGAALLDLLLIIP